MNRRALVALLSGLVLAAAAGIAWTQDMNAPARDLFGAIREPAPLAARTIGGYSEGCIAGATALPITGPAWQAMRLQRNRNWGHPNLVAYLERFATDAQRLDGWPGLLVGDMAQPRGGPMASGHASHQTGLDADIWYLPMPNHVLSNEERASMSAINLLRPGTLEVDPQKWNEGLFRLLRRAASYPEVARIFVSPGIKQMLCNAAGRDRDWLRVIRPWYGHADHFHVRLDCPPGDGGCVEQAAPPAGDGCGEELAYWLGPEPYRPAPGPPQPPAPPKTLRDLPATCTTVLMAGFVEPPPPPLPRPRP
jgi:penicillin-insensitive murein endopeptidase